ncbi:MAG: hypothetical protein U5L45_06200 [Saprospiraceae bacterium]|nr:hypothetical protein [Saprospiraceae bacterium]
MVHFSGKARKMNHIPSFPASEASAKSCYLNKYLFSKTLWEMSAVKRAFIYFAFLSYLLQIPLLFCQFFIVLACRIDQIYWNIEWFDKGV